jgi:predicted P-loop ATPase/GTPase
MRRRRAEQRLDEMAQLLDKLDRSVERIELVTVVREPNTGMSADAYAGLRKQVIAAVGERTAHLHQLAQFDSALRTGATAEELTTVTREWLAQAALDVLEDPAVAEAFEFVGPDDASGVRVLRPAYVDGATGRVIKAGVAERFHQEIPAPEVGAAEAEAEPDPEPVPSTTTTGEQA